MIDQKIFNFKIKQNLGIDDFFISKSNKYVHDVLFKQINPEKYIYLKGPSKSGKTHLGTLWLNNNNASLLNNDNYKELINSKSNIFIDNFDNKISEEKLFHLINNSYNNNSKILMTSSISLSEHNFKLLDLLSRLKTFYFIEIQDPDDELICNLLIKLLNDRQIKIRNEEIFSYIIKRINRTYLDIYNFINKIDSLSLSKKREITIPLIKELL